MVKVIWTEPAAVQFESILDFIGLDKPDAARTVAARIFNAVEHLERHVRLGRSIPEFPHPSFRQVWIKPSWLYYRLSKGTIHIVHVRRGKKPLLITDLINEDA
jgi:toxin ParE1/3/4